nr:retrovirus-related Pol polyprotein from transposon TNT 1-94 [Tanacetum cinerariifolium]
MTSSDALTFESVFVIGNLKEQLQGRGNTIRELKEKISHLQKKHSEADPILDFKALDSHNKDLNAKVNALQDLNERFRAENEKIKGMMKCVTMPDPVKPKFLAPGRYAIDVELIPSQNRNNKEVHLDYLKHLKKSVRTLQEIVKEAMVEKPLDCLLVSACLYTKPSQELLEYKMTKTNELMIPSTGVKDATTASGSKPRINTKKDRTFPAKSDKKKVEDHFSYNKSSVQQKNRVDSSISYKRTCDLQGILCGRTRTQSFSIKEFCESDLEVAFRKHSCYGRDVNSVDLIKVNRGTNLYTISVEDMMKSLLSAYCPRSVATACYTQNQSFIHTHHNKTPYELVQYKKPDLKFLHVFGAVFYPTNDSEDLGKLRPTADIGIFVVQPPISHQGVVAGPTIKDNPFAQADNDPFVNVFAQEPSSYESSSGDVSSAESTQLVPPYNQLGNWSKDQPPDNVIGNPSCSVSTKK